MKTILTPLALAVVLLAGAAPAARAGLILQPASASTDMGTFPGSSPDNVCNQSGLSAGYTSLVTDFATYIASNPTHDSRGLPNTWVSSDGTLTGNFDFALGGTFTVQSFALWNGENVDDVIGFKLLADDNAAFSSPTVLGSFTAKPTGPDNAVLPEVFSFAPTSASFVRMVITGNGGGGNTIFGEAAFEVQSSPTAVPEPASLTLLGLGALSLAGYGWRRQKRQAH